MADKASYQLLINWCNYGKSTYAHSKLTLS